jgi:hypothetical protein
MNVGNNKLREKDFEVVKRNENDLEGQNEDDFNIVALDES